MSVFLAIVNVFVGVCAGLGAGAYIIVTKMIRKELRELRSDIDAMYLGHGVEPPSMERFRREHPKDAADIATRLYGPMDDRGLGPLPPGD